jgi:GNAT superfamily N-acetyltransferase
MKSDFEQLRTKIKSLGYRTDLMFPAFEGEIVDRGEYLVVTTPSNPTFYWGNFLLFERPPTEGDFELWPGLFEAEIGAPPAYEHQALGWDSPDGEEGVIEPFLRAGFEPDRSVVLTSAAPIPPARPAAAIHVRRLESEHDWEQALGMQVLCREPRHEEAQYRTYVGRSMDRYRRMAIAARGAWYGAFLDGQLVADCGLFHDGELGRYQSVETHPEYRRRGIAGRMIYEAGRMALEQHGLRMLVMVAEAESDAARLYQSLGFAPTEKMMGLLKFPEAAQSGKTPEQKTATEK